MRTAYVASVALVALALTGCTAGASGGHLSQAEYLAKLHHYSGLRTVTAHNVARFSDGNCQMIADADQKDPRMGALNAVTALGLVAHAPAFHDAQAAFRAVVEQWCPDEVALVEKAATEG